MRTDCLESLVSVPGYCDSEDAQFRITQLTGISVATADAAADGDDISGVELLKEKRMMAAQEIINEFNTFVAAKFKAGTILQEDVVGYYNDNLVSQPAQAGKLQGMQLKIENDSFIEVYIECVTIQTQQAVTDNLLIVDFRTGLQIASIPFTTVANQITRIPIERTFAFNKQKVNIGFLYSGVATYQTSYWATGQPGCLTCPRWGGYANAYFQARGITMSAGGQYIDNSLTGSGYTNGMALHYSVQCSASGYICQNRNVFGMAMLYKFGSLVMQELQYSKRLNSIIAYYGEDHQELADKYEAKYSESMDKIVRGMKLPESACFECYSPVRTIVRVP